MIYYEGDYGEFNTPTKAVLGIDPITSGTASSFSINNSDDDDGADDDGNLSALDQSGISATVYGYFVPPMSGSWIITLTADDIADLYFGDTAICGWNDTNYLILRILLMATTRQLSA